MQFRAAKPSELKRVVHLADAVFRPKGCSMGDVFPVLFSVRNCPNLRIVTDGHKPVSLMATVLQPVSVYGHQLVVGSLGSVGTIEAYRGRGLATRLLFTVFDWLRECNADIISISGSRGLYRKNHCVQAGRTDYYTIRKKDLPRAGTRVNLVTWHSRHLDDLARLYQTETLRYIRSRDYWQAMQWVIKHRTWFGREVGNVLIKTGGRTLAYLHFLITGGKGKRTAWVREYAGARQLVIDSLPAVFKRFRLDAFTVGVADSGDGFVSAFKKMGIRPQVKKFSNGWTFRVCCFARMMNKLRPYIAERAGNEAARALRFTEQGNQYIIRYKKEILRLDNVADVTCLVLGTINGREKRLVPKKGRLAQILPMIFPVRLPLSGLNYV